MALPNSPHNLGRSKQAVELLLSLLAETSSDQNIRSYRDAILVSRRLGAFQIQGLTHDLEEIHDFYACRVTLADGWVPTDDISERVMVTVSEFLDTLPWGRTDPRAAFLLDRALEVEPSLWCPA